MDASDTPTKRVLYVNFDFPPMSGPGIWRALGFAKYLPEHGFAPTILCSDRSPSRTRFDPSLLEQIPPETTVVRVSSVFQNELAAPLDRAADALKRPRIAKTLRRLKSRLVREYPDQQAHWALKVAARGTLLATRARFHALVTSGPPHIAHLAGLSISSACRLPWVMDYRDLWTDDRVQIKQSSYQQSLFEHAEAMAIRRCDAVVVVSPVYRDHLSSRFSAEKSVESFHVIRNGHDMDEETMRRAQTLPSNPRLHIHFNGTPQVTHPFPMLATVVERLRQDPDRRRDVPRFTFTGMPESFARLVEERGLGAELIDIGHQTHRASIEHCLSCDVLLAMVNDANPLYRGTVPGKAYEALALGRHILALLPAGSVVEDMVAESGNGSFCPVDDPERLYKAVCQLIDDHRRGLSNRATLGEDWKQVARRYSRRSQAKELAQLLDSLQ
jgi:glycosyltransferase involved in cell wall biosynthesis